MAEITGSLHGEQDVSTNVFPTTERTIRGEVTSRSETLSANIDRVGMIMRGVIANPERSLSGQVSRTSATSIPGPQGPPGVDGEDGVSPVIQVSNVTNGHRLTITDVKGTKTVDIMDGKDGIDGLPGAPGPAGEPGRDGVDGKDGQDGRDGLDGSPGRDGVDGKDGLPGKDGEPGPAGRDGKDGVDGKPGKDGYTPVKGVDYFDGKDGVDGKDGYTPIKGIDYFDGEKGEPGYTPVKGVDYFDGQPGADGKPGDPGKDGAPGADGQPGKDGVSPSISVSDITGGHRITITDADGVKILDVMDGVDGATPQKGVDYLTPADKGEIVSQVIAGLPTGTVQNAVTLSTNQTVTGIKTFTASNFFDGEQKLTFGQYCPTVTDIASGIGASMKNARAVDCQLYVAEVYAPYWAASATHGGQEPTSGLTAKVGVIDFYVVTGAAAGQPTGRKLIMQMKEDGLYVLGKKVKTE